MPRLRLAIIGLLGFDHQSADQSEPSIFESYGAGASDIPGAQPGAGQ